jgi:hypothetical protein
MKHFRKPQIPGPGSGWTKELGFRSRAPAPSRSARDRSDWPPSASQLSVFQTLATARRCVRWLRKCDPGRCMIARLFAAAHVTVHTGCGETLRQWRTEQQMIDAETGVAGRPALATWRPSACRRTATVAKRPRHGVWPATLRRPRSRSICAIWRCGSRLFPQSLTQKATPWRDA